MNTHPISPPPPLSAVLENLAHDADAKGLAHALGMIRQRLARLNGGKS